MILIKKIDVPRHLAARRALHRASALPVILPRATSVSVVAPAGAVTSASKSIETSSQERCFSSLPDTP